MTDNIDNDASNTTDATNTPNEIENPSTNNNQTSLYHKNFLVPYFEKQEAEKPNETTYPYDNIFQSIGFNDKTYLVASNSTTNKILIYSYDNYYNDTSDVKLFCENHYDNKDNYDFVYCGVDKFVNEELTNAHPEYRIFVLFKQKETTPYTYLFYYKNEFYSFESTEDIEYLTNVKDRNASGIDIGFIKNKTDEDKITRTYMYYLVEGYDTMLKKYTYSLTSKTINSIFTKEPLTTSLTLNNITNLSYYQNDNSPLTVKNNEFNLSNIHQFMYYYDYINNAPTELFNFVIKVKENDNGVSSLTNTQYFLFYYIKSSKIDFITYLYIPRDIREKGFNLTNLIFDTNHCLVIDSDNSNNSDNIDNIAYILTMNNLNEIIEIKNPTNETPKQTIKITFNIQTINNFDLYNQIQKHRVINSNNNKYIVK